MCARYAGAARNTKRNGPGCFDISSESGRFPLRQHRLRILEIVEDGSAALVEQLALRRQVHLAGAVLAVGRGARKIPLPRQAVTAAISTFPRCHRADIQYYEQKAQ